MLYPRPCNPNVNINLNPNPLNPLKFEFDNIGCIINILNFVKKIVLHKAQLHAYAYKEITEKCTQPAVQSHFLTAVIVWVVPIKQPSRLTIDPVLSLSSHRSHT